MNVTHACSRSALLAVLALLTGCATVGNTVVHAHIYDMNADGATLKFSNGGHCSRASNSLSFLPGEGVMLTLDDYEDQPATLRIRIDLGVSRTFAFAAQFATSTLAPGAPPVVEVLPLIKHTPAAIPRYIVNTAVSVMSGPAPDAVDISPNKAIAPKPITNQLFDADWELETRVTRPAQYTLQLPDAIVNGRRVQFAPIRMTLREVTYTHDQCLR